MLIRLGFSADPDDAFMFWGLASGTVDPRRFDFEPVSEEEGFEELSLASMLMRRLDDASVMRTPSGPSDSAVAHA